MGDMHNLNDNRLNSQPFDINIRHQRCQKLY